MTVANIVNNGYTTMGLYDNTVYSPFDCTAIFHVVRYSADCFLPSINMHEAALGGDLLKKLIDSLCRICYPRNISPY